MKLVLSSVLALSLAVVSSAFGQEDDLSNFCTQAQQIVANTELVSENVIFDDFDAFVSSKAAVDESRLMTTQFVLYEERGDGEAPFAKGVSCKVKSVDIINETYGTGTAGEMLSCRAINQHTVSEILGQLGGDAPQVIFDDDEVNRIGPQWIEDAPYDAALRDEDGVIHIRASGLYVPNAAWIPMPAQFKGVQYCHLISPAYAREVLAGK